MVKAKIFRGEAIPVRVVFSKPNETAAAAGVAVDLKTGVVRGSLQVGHAPARHQSLREGRQAVPAGHRAAGVPAQWQPATRGLNSRRPASSWSSTPRRVSRSSRPASTADSRRRRHNRRLRLQAERHGNRSYYFDRLAVQQRWLVVPLFHGVERRASQFRIDGRVHDREIQEIAPNGDYGTK